MVGPPAFSALFESSENPLIPGKMKSPDSDKMKYNINEGFFIYQPVEPPSCFEEIKETLSDFFDILKETMTV